MCVCVYSRIEINSHSPVASSNKTTQQQKKRMSSFLRIGNFTKLIQYIYEIDVYVLDLCMKRVKTTNKFHIKIQSFRFPQRNLFVSPHTAMLWDGTNIEFPITHALGPRTNTTEHRVLLLVSRRE